MSRVRYNPEKPRVNADGVISLLQKGFGSHESGLPEWLKNSADAYVREGTPEESRLIVVVFDYRRHGVDSSISCLDFVGMTCQDIDQRFLEWGDPDAASGGVATTVQGGHGNGGKVYMTRLFDSYSTLTTARDGKLSVLAVDGGRHDFGYSPDRDRGRGIPCISPSEEIASLLESVGCRVEGLPANVVKAVRSAKGFTLVRGVGPTNMDERTMSSGMVDALQGHAQMTQTLELCKVYVVAGGRAKNRGKPLSLPAIEPKPGAETPRSIGVPRKLKDPNTGKKIDTCEEGCDDTGTLVLRTSKVKMIHPAKKARHSITFKAGASIVGYRPVGEFDVQSPYAAYIYGDCELAALGDFTQNARTHLTEGPLTRAVEHFIARSIEDYSAEFESKDDLRATQEERRVVEKMSAALDKWKNEFISECMRGYIDRREGGGGGDPPPDPLPVRRPELVEIGLTHPRAGLGVSIKPTVKFYDGSGAQVRPVPYVWMSDDNNVAMPTENGGRLETFSHGRTELWVETLDGPLRSDRATLEVSRIQSVQIEPADVELAQWSKTKLSARCVLADGGTTDDVYVTWYENDDRIARVTPAGLVFAYEMGETLVAAGDDHCQSDSPTRITVVAGTRSGEGNDGLPRLLVAGYDPDPLTRQDRKFKRADPPILQRPEDVSRNLWWLNTASPLARLYLSSDRGYGYDGPAWRHYFLERYVDMLVQWALLHTASADEAGTVDNWITDWGSLAADIQEHAMASLDQFLVQGALPGE